MFPSMSDGERLGACVYRMYFLIRDDDRWRANINMKVP